MENPFYIFHENHLAADVDFAILPSFHTKNEECGKRVSHTLALIWALAKTQEWRIGCLNEGDPNGVEFSARIASESGVTSISPQIQMFKNTPLVSNGKAVGLWKHDLFHRSDGDSIPATKKIFRLRRP